MQASRVKYEDKDKEMHPYTDCHQWNMVGDGEYQQDLEWEQDIVSIEL